MSAEKQGTELPKLEVGEDEFGCIVMSSEAPDDLTQIQALEVIRRAEAYPALEAENTTLKARVKELEALMLLAALNNAKES